MSAEDTQGQSPIAQFAKLESEVHHLREDQNQTRDQLGKLDAAFGRVATEVHMMRGTVRWAAGVLGAIIATGVAAVLWRVVP